MAAREDKNADMKEGEDREEMKDESKEEEKGEDEDMENMDKNDRDNMEDNDDIKGEEEKRDDNGVDELETEQQMGECLNLNTLIPCFDYRQYFDQAVLICQDYLSQNLQSAP